MERQRLRYRRLRISAGVLLGLYVPASLALGGALYATGKCQEDDWCILDFPYGFYAGVAGAMMLPLVGAGATVLGIGRRRERRLSMQAPGLAVDPQGARVSFRVAF